MPFSEPIKLQVKRNAAFRCCRCHEIGIDIHHIIPQSEGGLDTIDNAAPLCQNCHDRFGDNPQKRKELSQMRDWWYEIVKDKYSPNPSHRSDVTQVGREILDFIVASLSQNPNLTELSQTSTFANSREQNSIRFEFKHHDARKYITVDNVGDSDAFALIVSGEAMAPRFSDGDIIVVSPRARYKNGDICVVRVAGKDTLNIIQFDEQYIHLIPLNPAYEPVSVSKNRVTFVFKVVKLIANL